MPEAQRDFDQNVVRTAINQINTNSSYERIETQRDLNWSSASSIDECYKPLVAARCAVKQPTRKHSQVDENVLASSETPNFCCCSGEARRDLSSCWKSKRRQIIWESAHASAKNRTAAAAATTTRTRRNAAAAAVTTSAAPNAVLPTQNSSTTTAVRRNTFNAANNLDAAVSSSKGVSNTSTSLPATPNLSHLQRRKYKKLSLQGEEFVPIAAQQQEQLSQSQTTQQQTVALAKQLQMSATKVRSQLNAVNTATSPTTLVGTFRTTADPHPRSMLHAHDAFAISAAATATPMKVPASQAARFLAKNNNINYNNDNNNHNNNNGALSSASSRSKKSTQPPHTTCDSYSATAAATTTATTTTNTAPRSALTFCEHCCESASMKSSSDDRHAEATRLYCEDVDSVVSGELSSFRLISEEEASTNSVSSATRSLETAQLCVAFVQATNNQTVAASTRPSSPATTAAICCYTIGHAAVDHSATVASGDARPSAPVPIPPPANCSSAAATPGLLSTSLPSNCASVSGDTNHTVSATHADAASTVRQHYCGIPQSSVKRKPASAPVPPPKPQRDAPLARHSNKNRSFGHASYDPTSFHRKLQKFEKQTALLSPANTLTRAADVCDDEERAECSSPEPCELLNCFGAVKSTHERGGVARNASSSGGCCAAPHASNLKSANNNNINNNSDNHVAKTKSSVCAIAKLVEANNNYNCKINVANSQCEQQFSSTPVLNKRILRYDSCGRLKADGSWFQPAVKAQKSLSESRLPQSVAGACNGNKFAPAPCGKLNFYEASTCASINNGYAPQEHSTFQAPNSKTPPTSPKSPTSPTTPNPLRNKSDLDLSFVAQQQPEAQLFKSYSDTQNFVPSNLVPRAITPSSGESSAQTLKQPQQRSYSDYTLKSSHYPNFVDRGCRCAAGARNAGAPTTQTNCRQSPALIHQKNSVSLPNVPQSNGSQSPEWLSSETVASSRSELKCSEDTQSVCSDQTTIFHLEHDYSSSSSPSSQICGNVVLRGPLLLTRIPEIQSSCYPPAYSQSLGNTNAREQVELSMEKRRNTLDRFQRLGFGRKSSPSSSAASATQTQSQESHATRHRKSSEKSEKLKELTELLRGNRSSPTPPPVPPPRRPRHEFHSATNSFEQPDKQDTPTSLASAIDSTPLSFMSTQSDDILLMDHEESNADEATSDGRGEHKVNSFSHVCSSKHLRDLLKPHTSLTNIDVLTSGREKSRSPPPILEVDSAPPASSDIDTKLSRPESRTVIGSYAQKGIPFRSASFSQLDYSSGKYKKSALSVLRDRLRRDKAVDRAPSPTLPRNKDTGEAVLLESEKKEPDWVYIPLKRSDWNCSSEHKSLEDVAESPDAIIEEDVFAVEKEPVSVKQFDPETAHAAHAKMESLSDAIVTEKDDTVEEEQLPITVESENLSSGCPAAAFNVEPPEGKHVTSNLATLATLMEEEMPLESPPDNFLQTATTCLIPVPVYECAAQDWRLENPPTEWVEVASEEFGIVPETLQPLVSMDQCSVAQPEPTDELEHRADAVPTISVKRSSEEEGVEDEDILRKKPDHDDVPKSQDTNMLARRQASLDYPEVKKRYSHDDLEIGTEKRSSLDSMATRYSADERKRLDKSRRRKGMYIESTDWSDGAAAATRALALDITIANFNAIKDDSPEECSSTMYLNSPITEENRTPGSLYSLELNTPDSEPSKPPIWNKAQRLISFSCQSSEERDESHSTGSGRSTAREVYAVGTPGVALGRNNTSYPFLRTDSISDNESDRTPPPSGVGSSENDFKRYSKRPLRGPYGQMLEAEMKKPNKMHFEEILEELRESEGISSQPRRARVPVYGGRHDESDDVVDVVGGGRNMPQHSNSMRVRKTNTYLPVPSHARAASTPSQIENVNTGNNASSVSGLNKINPHEKRYQSTLDNTMTREKRDALASEAHQNQHQHHQAQAQLQQQQREIKRDASETPAMKPHHSKRSQSMGSEKPAAHHQHHHQQKRSLDVAVAGGGGKQKTAANLMPTQELLAELLKGSSEKLLSEQRQQMFADTRTHVVQEIFKNEQSYVESLQTVVMKYLRVLKAPENAGMIDSRTVDEIFFMVPDILEIHQKFLGEMRARLDNWDTQQKVGDAFMETFSKLEVLEVYTSFVNNCNRAKNAIRSTKHQRPSFAKFLETTAREHKGKLTLDNLLIKPVQKFPNYEMLFSRLIKHTDHDHPDQKHLQDVLKLVHDILVHINCKEREILENGQREAVLRELEGVIEGIADLSAPDRQFLLFDLVSMPSGQGARKERGFFLFNDLLVLTSIKKRSGTIRKPNPTTCPGTVASTLDTNKYKFLTKISLDCLEIVKTKDENLKRIMSEIENLAEDCNKLQQITEITASLKYPHQYLEDVIRELHRDVQRQLSERQTNDAQLNMLELAVTSPNGSQKLSIVFNKAEKRSQWEKSFNDAKQRLAATLERHPIPEFLTSIPIRKTRAGLQFTCAAATLSEKRNVWVCNSDGYVGQVCIMSLHPEPNVSSCNGVCNARILCVASVPAFSGSSTPDPRRRVTTGQQQHHHHNHQQSDTQQHDFRKSNSPSCQTGSCAVGGVQPERKKLNSTTAPSSNNNNHNNNINNASSESNTQLDLNFSSSDDEPEAAGLAAATANSSISTERVPSPAPSIHPSVVGLHQHQDSNPDEGDGNQSTMWIGTEDGCIHVYNSTDNIRIKKNRIKIEHHSAVYSILYLDNRVFVSLANGDICVYWRDGVGWNTSSAHCVSIGTVSSPVSKLLSVHGKLWCSIQGIIKVLDIETLLVVNQIQISTDSKPITNMAVCNNYVWISIQNSAHIKCFHSNSHHLITEVNLAPAVNKMLSNCDEIIRQHKAACLRVTSLLSCKDLIWIGTSAGVLLTIPAQGYEKGTQNVMPTGIPHGHTGHVRFLTFVETSEAGQVDCAASSTAASSTTKDGGDSSTATTTTDLKSASKHSKTKAETNNILVISGGDGYEDFRNSGANSLSEIAGREDSTNHLLIWQI